MYRYPRIDSNETMPGESPILRTNTITYVSRIIATPFVKINTRSSKQKFIQRNLNTDVKLSLAAWTDLGFFYLILLQ
jgi:hypothetical protein